jgi:hypothetical protein
MRKHVITYSYWLGSACAALGLLARGLDAFGMNFIDFSTKGSGVGYHSLMDGTLFFYMISIASASYDAYLAKQVATAPERVLERNPSSMSAEEAYSTVEM